MTDDGAAAAPWTVELSEDAARAVRQAAPVVRRHLADLLDHLVEEGLPPTAQPLGGSSYLIRTGDREAVVAVDTQDRSIVVARLTAADRPPVRDALRAARVPPVAASRMAALLDEVWGEIRTSVRGFRRSPAFTLSVLATLAVAIGGATTLFGLANTVFRAELPFDDSDELLRLRDRRLTAGGDLRIFNMAPLNVAAIREQASTLSGVVAAGGVNHVLTGGEVAERVNVIRVSDGWADVLGIRARLGRVFNEEEERLGAEAGVALLSHSLWQSRFGSDPGIVGRRVPYEDGVWTIVGVLQPRFRYPYDADLWIPWRWDPTDGTSHDLNVVGRMAQDATIGDVRRDLDRIAARLQEARPDTNADLFHNAETLRGDFIRDDDRVLVALMAAVGFLLVLACVNVTNLFVARFIGRQREVGIRVAMGAGRLREIRGFMVESVLLFLVGGVLGLILTLWLGNALNVLVPDVLRTQLAMHGIRLSAELLSFALGLALAAGVVFGGIAAARGTRTDVSQVLKDGGRGGSARSARIQRVLVVSQLALSLALLVGAAMLFEHFERLREDDLGFEVENLYTLRISVDQDRFSDVDARLDVVRRLRETIAGIPGIHSVAYTTVNPLCCGDWGAPLEVEGRERPPGTTHLIHHRLVGPGYFETTGTSLLSGRDFDARDAPGTVPTVIVDEALARRFWPSEDAVGKRVRIDRPGQAWRTIVGVVGDVDEEGDYTETWYLPYTQDPTARSTGNLHFMIRAAGPDALAEARTAVRAVDDNLAVYALRAMEELRAENISQDRLGAAVATGFAAFGLLLAALGVFGMLSYSVNTRTREIGTRIALGAHPRDVTRLVVQRALRLGTAGSVLGIGAALALGRILQGVVFGVQPASLWLLGSSTVLLLATAAAAAAFPAVRAARVDPLEALKD